MDTYIKTEDLEEILYHCVDSVNQQMSYGQAQADFRNGERAAYKAIIANLPSIPKGSVIPTEWIKEYREKNRYDIELYECIGMMLEDWEKEHDQ